MNRITLLSAAVGTVLACASLPSSAAELVTTKKPIAGQYIVVLKSDAASLASERALGVNAKAASVASVASSMTAQHKARLIHSYQNALRGFVVNADDNALAKLLADPRVAYVQEDGIASIAATQTGATWGIDRIDQRDLPLNQTYTYDTTASTVHAYIIDTGLLSSHSQFANRVGNGWSAIADGRGTTDCNGHGTHVSGTVGGSTWGVAKGVTIHPVRVLGCDGTGSFSGIVDGIDWVASNHTKPAVANMSLGGDANQATDDAVARLVNAGVTVVVAAGNAGYDACGYSPARAASAITVGSTNNQDARSIFSVGSSNYGSCLDIFAPGSNIVSAGISSTTASATMSGTSMASPHVAGAAALYLASNPSATPAQVRTALVNNATSGKVTDAKTGSPNKLLYSLSGGTPPSTYSISGTITTSAGAGISGVTVSNGSLTATTNSSGAYTLTGLANATYTLTPSLSGYTFSPTSRSVTVNSADVSGVNFTGTGSGGGGQTYSNAGNYTIYDNYTVYSPIAVSGRTGYGSASTPVSVDIKHTFRGDLRIDLIAPDGSTYLLKNYDVNDSADNVLQTYSVNLSTEALNGTWYLRVSDNAVNDTGYIDSWSLTF